jgi:N-acetyl-gamma-glutamyl-phosphate reductase
MHTVTKRSEASQSPATVERPAAKVAVAGATGYTGQELIRLLARHPFVELTAAMSSGTAAPRQMPALARLWKGVLAPLDREALVRESDVVFLALPDAVAAELAPQLVDQGLRVVDLSGAFRLRDPSTRARYYPETHSRPDGVVYGLTEHARDQIASARFIANPGCYPTATLTALLPPSRAGLLLPDADVIVDAKSGISGAGKTPSERTHFSECYGNLSAYGVFNHRHAAEIEEVLGERINFVPHLLPINRGILATIYVRLRPGANEETLARVYEEVYRDAPFVRLVGPELPEIKHVANTNFCDIGWRVDATGRTVIVSVIDNLLKGASGQAVQNLNVMLGIDESAGLM